MAITLDGSNGVTTPDLTVDTDTLTVDATNNRVGIGTSSPSQRLEVAGAGFVAANISGDSTSETQLRFSSNTAARISQQANQALVFDTNATEAMRLDSSGNLKFNSGYGSAATAYGCRAWVNFNGTGTVAIRASGNVSSITDAGVGSYFVNFTNAMPDTNYSPIHSYTTEFNVQHTVGFLSGVVATTYFGVQYFNVANSAQASDKSIVAIAVFR